MAKKKERPEERKRAQEALRETEERFRLAFEDSPIGMGIVGLH